VERRPRYQAIRGVTRTCMEKVRCARVGSIHKGHRGLTCWHPEANTITEKNVATSSQRMIRPPWSLTLAIAKFRCCVGGQRLHPGARLAAGRRGRGPIRGRGNGSGNGNPNDGGGVKKETRLSGGSSCRCTLSGNAASMQQDERSFKNAAKERGRSGEGRLVAGGLTVQV
jgi:hypothetical protein